MADGALVFGANLNATCLTSRAKKVNSSSNVISVAANMRRKTRQSNRRDIHNRVTLNPVVFTVPLVQSRPENAELNESSCLDVHSHAVNLARSWFAHCVCIIHT